LHSSGDVNAESSKSTSSTFEHPEKWSWDIPSKNRKVLGKTGQMGPQSYTLSLKLLQTHIILFSPAVK